MGVIDQIKPKTMNYYEIYGVLLMPSKTWEFDNYGFYPEGMGDCISHTMQEARRNKNLQQVLTCVNLLSQRKRWPDELNCDRVAKNELQQHWSKLMQKLKINKQCLYRPQQSVTRDPYTFTIAACHSMGRMDIAPKPPWWLYRPQLWTWRHYLITGKGKKAYEFFAITSIRFLKHDYVERMIRVMAEEAKSEKILKYLDR